MQPFSPAEKIGEQVLDLHRKRLVCRLLREEGLLAANTDLVLRFADRLLRSYSYRVPNRK
jgi:hypothetical protein